MKKKAVQSLIALCLCSSLIVGCGNTVVQSKPTIETTEETETAPEVIKYSEDEIRSIAKNNGLVRSYDDFDEVSFYYANRLSLTISTVMRTKPTRSRLHRMMYMWSGTARRFRTIKRC